MNDELEMIRVQCEKLYVQLAQNQIADRDAIKDLLRFVGILAYQMETLQAEAT